MKKNITIFQHFYTICIMEQFLYRSVLVIKNYYVQTNILPISAGTWESNVDSFSPETALHIFSIYSH